MFGGRVKKISENKSRVESLIQRDRSAMKLQEKLEIREAEKAKVDDIWDYSLFRKVIGDSKKKLNNWWWDR